MSKGEGEVIVLRDFRFWAFFRSFWNNILEIEILLHTCSIERGSRIFHKRQTIVAIANKVDYCLRIRCSIWIQAKSFDPRVSEDPCIQDFQCFRGFQWIVEIHFYLETCILSTATICNRWHWDHSDYSHKESHRIHVLKVIKKSFILSLVIGHIAEKSTLSFILHMLLVTQIWVEFEYWLIPITEYL